MRCAYDGLHNNTDAHVAPGFRGFTMSSSTPTLGAARLACKSLFAVLLLAAVAVSAQTQQGKNEERKRSQTPGSVKFLPGSQESEATRTKRLKRECRGRPNAGACLGHAS